MGKVTRYKIQVDGFTYQVSVEDESGCVAAVSKEAPAAAPRQSAPEAPKAARPQKRERLAVNTMMPGRVCSILVQVGDEVNEGDTLLMLEAMKMESPIYATKSGVIDSIEVKTGDNVAAGQVLLNIL